MAVHVRRVIGSNGLVRFVNETRGQRRVKGGSHFGRSSTAVNGNERSNVGNKFHPLVGGGRRRGAPHKWSNVRYQSVPQLRTSGPSLYCYDHYYSDRSDRSFVPRERRSLPNGRARNLNTEWNMTRLGAKCQSAHVHVLIEKLQIRLQRLVT